jgi:MFS family permease
MAGGYPLGYIADRWGRRPVFFLGLITEIIFSLAYGLSTTLGQAIAMRFLLGFTNGIVATSKTVVSEVCAKGDSETRGMGMIVGCWGLGLTVGPAIGGFLAGRGWASHPFLLPNVVCALIALASAPLVHLYVPETGATATADGPLVLEDKGEEEDVGAVDEEGDKDATVLGEDSGRLLGHGAGAKAKARPRRGGEEGEGAEEEEEEEEEPRLGRRAKGGFLPLRTRDVPEETSVRHSQGDFSRRRVAALLVLYGCLSMYVIMIDEVGAA